MDREQSTDGASKKLSIKEAANKDNNLKDIVDNEDTVGRLT